MAGVLQLMHFSASALYGLFFRVSTNSLLGRIRDKRTELGYLVCFVYTSLYRTTEIVIEKENEHKCVMDVRRNIIAKKRATNYPIINHPCFKNPM